MATTKASQTPEYQLLLGLLRRTRKNAGVSQRQLSESLGQTHNYINYVENGRKRIDVIEFFKIAEMLGVEPEALFGELARELRKL